ncbi:hypothetical protein ScPMuIL_010963 [Solemya velum]
MFDYQKPLIQFVWHLCLVGVCLLLWCSSGNAGIADTWKHCECEWQPWEAWSECSEECYGIKIRERSVQLTQYDGCDEFTDCATNDMGSDAAICNSVCFNAGTYMSSLDTCHCVSGRYGRCCRNLVTCGDPGGISNGRKSGSNFEFNGQVTYRCDQHHNMTGGDSKRVCQDTGMWSGLEPTCVFVNTCGSAPCQHGGECIDGLNEYTCVCLPGWSGKDCQNDVQPPIASNCSGDIHVFTGETVTTVTWIVPEFHDPMDKGVTVVANYDQSQYEFPWGDFNISYVATKAHNAMTSECTFTIKVRPHPCEELNIPKNGARVCNGWMTDFGQYCLVFCSSNFTLPRNYDFRQWYVCGASGHWIAPIPMPNCSVPVYSFMETPDSQTTEKDVGLKFEACPVDNADIASAYIEKLQSSEFSTICPNSDSCKTENVKVDCY